MITRRIASMPVSVVAAVVTIWVQVAGNGFNAGRLLWVWARRPVTFELERVAVWGLAVSLLLCAGLAVGAIAMVRRCNWARYTVLGFQIGYGLATVLLLLSGQTVALIALAAAVGVIALLLAAPADGWFTAASQ